MRCLPVNPLDIGRLDWYHDETGGGKRLHFDERCRINDLNSTRLEWLVENYKPRSSIDRQFRTALDEFYRGLLAFMRESDNYKFFIVPFGRSGKMINQVRDIQWLRRIQGSRVRRKRYPLFLKAVDLWIANPRHYEQTRDIGQSLARSQNDLYQEKESDGYETPDEISSGSFIQNDAEDEETESADGIVHDTNEAESEDYGESEQSTSLELESVNKDDDEDVDTTPLPSTLRPNLRSKARFYQFPSTRKAGIFPRPHTTPSGKNKRKTRHGMCDDSDEPYTPPMRKKRRNSSSDKKPLPEDNTPFVNCTRLGRNVRVTRSSGSALGSGIKVEDSQVRPSTDNQDEESDSIQEGNTILKRLYKRKKSPIIISDSPSESEEAESDDDIERPRPPKNRRKNTRRIIDDSSESDGSEDDTRFTVRQAPRLKRHIPNRSGRKHASEPTMVDGKPEYEIERVLKVRRRGRGWQFLIRWVNASQKWLPYSKLKDFACLEEWVKQGHDGPPDLVDRVKRASTLDSEDDLEELYQKLGWIPMLWANSE